DLSTERGLRPEAGAQRGSVADMPLYPGDPLTPGVGASAGAERLPREKAQTLTKIAVLPVSDAAPRPPPEKAQTLTKIPVLPISSADAPPLLEALSGPAAPEAWRGALPITYHLVPRAANARGQLAFDLERVPAA